MEHNPELKHSRKRKLDSQLGFMFQQASPNQRTSQEDLHEEIQQKLKKLKLNNSPLISPSTDEEQSFLMFSNRLSPSFGRRETETEDKKMQEEVLPISDYEEINYILGQIYFENQTMKHMSPNSGLNGSQTSSQNSFGFLENESDIDEYLKNSIAEFYRYQNRVLHQLWESRTINRMQE